MAFDAGSSALSSPDPLGNSASTSFQISSPTKPRARRALVSGLTTPNKKPENTIQLQDFILKTPPAGLIKRSQSPTKSIAKTENMLSPWRIRVTVQAERDDEQKGQDSGIGGKVRRSARKSGPVRTTTTTVPLKGLEESSPVPLSRRSGRSRKSDVGTSPVKESGTATLVRKRGRWNTLSDGDKSGRDRSIGATPAKRGRGRPRKSLPALDDEDVPMEEVVEDLIEHPGTVLGKRVGNRRRAMSPAQIAVDDRLGEDGRERQHKRHAHDTAFALGETSPNRGSSNSPKKIVVAESVTGFAVVAPQIADWPSPSSEQPAERTEEEVRPSESTSRNGGIARSSPDVRDRTSPDKPIDDPTSAHREYDSILESEGFTMVSLDSIASARQVLGRSAGQRATEPSNLAIERGDVPENQPTTSSANEVTMAPSSLTPDSIGKSGEASNGQQVNVSSEAVIQSGFSLQDQGQAAKPQVSSSSIRTKGQTAKSVSFAHKTVVLGGGTPSVSAGRPSPSVHSFAEARLRHPTTPYLPRSSLHPAPPAQQGHQPNATNFSKKRKADTPKLARVVRAGIALQGVLDPNARGSSAGNTHVSPVKIGLLDKVTGKSPKERLDDLFDGFGDGTRRELRAGLRLGEELARRQKLASQTQEHGESSALTRTKDDVFSIANDTAYPKLPTPEDKEEYALTLLAPVQVVEYPSTGSGQLMSPETSDRTERDEDEMSWKADTLVKDQTSTISHSLSEQEILVEPIDKEMQRRLEEWQREREAVSRQIEMANSSQVIMINNDDSEAMEDSTTPQGEDATSADIDIWQVEARSGDVSQASAPPNDTPLQEEVIKPRRSKIPSPWRRDSQMVYSDEVIEDPTGLFWQPDQRAIQLAKEREERKKRKGSHTDVSSMLRSTSDVDEQCAVVAATVNTVQVKETSQNEIVVTVEEERIFEVESTTESSHHSEDSVAFTQAERTVKVDAGIEESLYDEAPAEEAESYQSEASEEEVSETPSEHGASRDDTKSTSEYTEEGLEVYQPPNNAPPIVTSLHGPPMTSWFREIAGIVAHFATTTSFIDPPDELWTNMHYELLDAYYQGAKTDPNKCPYRPRWGIRPLLGVTITYQDYSVVITKAQLGIIDKFREVIKGVRFPDGSIGKCPWDEAYVARRLFSLIVGEDMRRRGLMND